MAILATNGQNGAMLQASHATQKAHLGGQGGLGLQSWWTKRVAQWPRKFLFSLDSLATHEPCQQRAKAKRQAHHGMQNL